MPSGAWLRLLLSDVQTCYSHQGYVVISLSLIPHFLTSIWIRDVAFVEDEHVIDYHSGMVECDLEDEDQPGTATSSNLKPGPEPEKQVPRRTMLKALADLSIHNPSIAEKTLSISAQVYYGATKVRRYRRVLV